MHRSSMSHRKKDMSGFSHRKTQALYFQYNPYLSVSHSNAAMQMDFDTAEKVTENLDLINPFSGVLTKMNEKEMLHGLNDRFAGFIGKVRRLEHQNELLEKEIVDIRAKVETSSLEQEYEPELTELRKMIQEITHQKHEIELEHHNLEEEVSSLRGKYEREARNRSDAEKSIMLLKNDISVAYQAKLQFDKKSQSLVDEIQFLKKNHEAEVSEMMAQIQEVQTQGEAQDFGKADLTATLRDIREQLEGHAVTDIHKAEESFRVQLAKLTEAAEVKREVLKATQLEIQEYRRRLQAKNIELDCAKGTREALERQLREVEERHDEELLLYQDTIKQLENELISSKFDMSGHLREYQDLLNVKMALDMEILSYRKLLEGEETRLLTVTDTHVSMPYVYRQSPVFTLPCLTRHGGPNRRAEPQYKFVEEIITETTREIEMSDFEETGSEEDVGGHVDEEKGVENGSRDEEDGDTTKGERGEGEPVSDRQHVEPAQPVDSGEEDISPAKEEQGERGDEQEEAQHDSEERTDVKDKTNDEVTISVAEKLDIPSELEREKCDTMETVNGDGDQEVKAVEKTAILRGEDTEKETTDREFQDTQSSSAVIVEGKSLLSTSANGEDTTGSTAEVTGSPCEATTDAVKATEGEKAQTVPSKILEDDKEKVTNIPDTEVKETPKDDDAKSSTKDQTPKTQVEKTEDDVVTLKAKEKVSTINDTPAIPKEGDKKGSSQEQSETVATDVVAPEKPLADVTVKDSRQLVQDCTATHATTDPSKESEQSSKTLEVDKEKVITTPETKVKDISKDDDAKSATKDQSPKTQVEKTADEVVVPKAEVEVSPKTDMTVISKQDDKKGSGQAQAEAVVTDSSAPEALLTDATVIDDSQLHVADSSAARAIAEPSTASETTNYTHQKEKVENVKSREKAAIDFPKDTVPEHVEVSKTIPEIQSKDPKDEPAKMKGMKLELGPGVTDDKVE